MSGSSPSTAPTVRPAAAALENGKWADVMAGAARAVPRHGRCESLLRDSAQFGQPWARRAEIGAGARSPSARRGQGRERGVGGAGRGGFDSLKDAADAWREYERERERERERKRKREREKERIAEPHTILRRKFASCVIRV